MGLEKKELILSASQINLFIEEPALWVLQYFYGVRGGSNIYAVRGKSVEEYVNEAITQGVIPTLSGFVKIAVAKSLQDNVEITEEDIERFYKWGEKVLPLVQSFKITGQQIALTGDLNGIKIKGYADFAFGDELVDLKTVSKVPTLLIRTDRKGMLSKDKSANVRQQVIYKELSGRDTSLLFVDEQGNSLHYVIQQSDIDEQLPIIQDAINKIKNILTMNLKDVILQISPKNINSFYWDEITRNKAKELWTITN